VEQASCLLKQFKICLALLTMLRKQNYQFKIKEKSHIHITAFYKYRSFVTLGKVKS